VKPYEPIDVLGLGNALVDILAYAEEDFLAAEGMRKGAATPLWGDGPGVLRRLTPHWLRAPDMRAIVIGFEEAGRGHGGAGALYVRLRRLGKAERPQSGAG
jgi:DNA-nicking Smr family endonuclease